MINVDKIILIGVWVVTILLVYFSTRLNQIREAFVIFAFKQILTWFFGILVVQYKLLEYPVREFPYATRTSFSFEYFIYPAVCIVFNLKFPKNKSRTIKILWYLFFPSWMTFLEVLIEKHTHLIHYIDWQWYWTWLTLLATFWLSRMFYVWFMKLPTGGTNSRNRSH